MKYLHGNGMHLNKIVFDHGVEGRRQAQHLWTALEEQLKRYEEDLETQYDGDPRWTDAEDGVFLRECVAVVKGMLLDLRREGFISENDIVVDGSRVL